jgi:hypothetical protein
MSEKTTRLVLKKAYFDDGFNGSMEQIVSGIDEKLPNKNERTYNPELFKTFEIALIEKPSNNDGVFVRIHSSEDGAIGLIDQEAESAQNDLEEHRPPEKKRFLSEEIVLYIKGNHIVACGLGNKDGVVQNIIGTIAEKAQLIEKSFRLKVSDVPNQVELKRAKEIGIKKIELGIDGYLASIDQLDHKSVKNKILEKIFGSPDSAESIRKRANTHGRLTLSRSKFKKEEIQKDDWLTSVGETIVESGAEDYTITLEDGTKISTAKLKVSKPVRIKKHANTFAYNEVKAALYQYYKDLQGTGSLDW